MIYIYIYKKNVLVFPCEIVRVHQPMSYLGFLFFLCFSDHFLPNLKGTILKPLIYIPSHYFLKSSMNASFLPLF